MQFGTEPGCFPETGSIRGKCDHVGAILQGGKIVKVLPRGKWLFFSCFFVRKLVIGFQII